MRQVVIAAAESSGGLVAAETGIVMLLTVAALVAIVVRRLRFPFTVALVVAGLGLAFLPEDFFQVEVSSELILAVLVPPLLFEATLHIPWSKLRADLVAVLLLAVGGTLVGSLTVGFVVGQVLDIPWAVAIAFGALISATDPVAVIAFFRSVGVSKRLTILVEGESLFNDGVAFVVFTLALGAAAPGASFALADAVGEFIVVAFGGIAVGLVLGYVVASLVLKNLDDHLIETAVTVAVAFGSYLLAEEFGLLFGYPSLHLSGILAVVAAGLVVGNVGLRNTSPSTRLTLENFWEFITFVVNSFVFLLLGLEIRISTLGDHVGAVVLAVAVIVIVRSFVVYGFSWLGGQIRPERRIPGAFQHVMFWGGLRGAISVALALSLADEAGVIGAETVETLQVMTFGVVLFTLLGQGLTIERLIRAVGLGVRREEAAEQQRLQASIYSMRAGRRELQRLREEGVLFPDLWEAMDDHYGSEIDRSAAALRRHLTIHPELESDMYLRSRADALRAERSAVLDARRRGLVSDEVLEALVVRINNHLAALEFIEGEAAEGELADPDPGSAT